MDGGMGKLELGMVWLEIVVCSSRHFEVTSKPVMPTYEFLLRYEKRPISDDQWRLRPVWTQAKREELKIIKKPY